MPGCGALGTMEGFRAAGEGRGQTRVGSASGLWWGGMEAYCGLDSQGPWNVSAASELLPCFRFCSFCKAFLDECPEGSSPPHSRATFLQLCGIYKSQAFPMLPSFSASPSRVRLGHPRSVLFLLPQTGDAVSVIFGCK